MGIVDWFVAYNMTSKDNIVSASGVVATDSSRINLPSPSASISHIKFDGKNYLLWSKAVMWTIEAYELSGHLDGTTPQPTDSVEKGKWKSKDALVVSWLIHSMDAHLSAQYVMMTSAKEMWDALAQQYSHRNNYAQAFEIRKQIRELRQGGLALASYYSTLTHLWQQLDSYRTCKPVDQVTLLALQDDLEKERVYDFLAGLNPEYDQIRVQVLGREKFPSLHDAYNLVQHEDIRRPSMMPPVASDRSAFTTLSKISDAPLDKSELKCDYCNGIRHTRETCFKLIGYPERRGGRGRGSGGRGGRLSLIHI